MLCLTCSTCTQPISNFDEVTLERTVCFGQCPQYKIAIRSDRTVQYEGIEHVKIKGKANTRITPEQVEKLIAAANAVNYFGLRDSYQTREDGCPFVGSDMPYAITSIKIGNRKKMITHYGGCCEKVDPPTCTFPIKLTEFEFKIDEIVETSRWVGSER
jgi:uncharacterized protein DUF6438